MLVYSGNMTVSTLDALVAKGYQVELTEESEYVNITKPSPEPQKSLEEAQA